MFHRFILHNRWENETAPHAETAGRDYLQMEISGVSHFSHFYFPGLVQKVYGFTVQVSQEPGC